jgi:hypothetical protein
VSKNVGGTVMGRCPTAFIFVLQITGGHPLLMNCGKVLTKLLGYIIYIILLCSVKTLIL